MSKTEQNTLPNQKSNPRDFRVGDFIKFINKKFGIPRQSEIMSELIENVYSPMKKDLNIVEKDEKGKNPKIALSEVCTDGILDQKKLDNLVLKYIAEFNKERNYECLKTDLENSQKSNSQPNSQPNSQIVEKGENNLQILTEKMREKTTSEMLEELKNHNFGSIDKTQILCFLEMLENMNMINFELNFENGGITINPEIALGENLGYNKREKKFCELMERFLDAKEIEKEVLGKIDKIRENPKFTFATKHHYGHDENIIKFVSPEIIGINGIIKDFKLQEEFANILKKIARENNTTTFSIDYLIDPLSGSRLTEYLFEIKNIDCDTFHEHNLSLDNVKINLIKFETFTQAISEFVELVKKSRQEEILAKKRYWYKLQSENWTEGKVESEGLINLKRHLLEIAELIKEIELKKLGKTNIHEDIKPTDLENWEMGKFLDKIKGLKIIENRIWDRDKFKKIIFNILQQIPKNMSQFEKENFERQFNKMKEVKITSENLVKILYIYFLEQN